MTTATKESATTTESELEYMQEVHKSLRQLKHNTTKKKHSDAVKAWWSKPKNRKRMCNIFTTPEHRKKMSEQWKAYYSDPENYRRLIQRMQDPDYRKRLSVGIKAFWEVPENKQRMIDAIRKGKCKRRKLKLIQKQRK
jgi:hypothetical protein